MKPISLLMAVAALSVAGCASVAGGANQPTGRSQDPVAQTSPGMGAAPVDPKMQAMQEMHRKMQAAKTPEERDALMKEHMSAMPDAMPMMGQMKGPMPMPMQNSKEAMPGGRMSDADAMRFDQQMQAMQAMHSKMQASKTPRERNALMSEHRKAMQGGMAMMGRMKGSMQMPMQDGKGGMRGGKLPAEQDVMMRRMDMMDMMMQMMMDREALKPAPHKRK